MTKIMTPNKANAGEVPPANTLHTITQWRDFKNMRRIPRPLGSSARRALTEIGSVSDRQRRENSQQNLAFANQHLKDMTDVAKFKKSWDFDPIKMKPIHRPENQKIVWTAAYSDEDKEERKEKAGLVKHILGLPPRKSLPLSTLPLIKKFEEDSPEETSEETTSIPKETSSSQQTSASLSKKIASSRPLASIPIVTTSLAAKSTSSSQTKITDFAVYKKRPLQSDLLEDVPSSKRQKL